MGCVQVSGKPDTLQLTWAADAKGYNPTELALMRGYINETLNWLSTIGWVDGDICCYRVGIPVLQSTQESVVDSLYNVEVSVTDQILLSIGVDMIKITTKSTNGYNDTYSYKSEYSHSILGNYYIDGVNNATRYVTPAQTIDVWGPEPIVIPEIVHNEKYMYIDEAEYNCNISKFGTIRAEYNGIRQIALPTKELPEYVVKAFTMIAQNFQLAAEMQDLPIVDGVAQSADKKGDIVYLSIPKLISKLTLARDRSDEKFYNEYYEDLHYIMEEVGLDKAFNDLKYGGQIEHLDMVIRIPASYSNEKMLKGLLEDKDVALHCNIPIEEVTDTERDIWFNYVFDSRMINEEAFSSKSVSGHAKITDLNDVDTIKASLGRIKAIDNVDYETIDNDDLWEINQWFDSDPEVSYLKSDIAKIKLLADPIYSITKGCKYSIFYPAVPAVGAYTDNDGIYHQAVEAIDAYWSEPTYRHYYVRASWLDGLDYSKVAIVFWAGFDLSTSSFSRCSADQIIMVIIIMVITYFTAGLGTTQAYGMVQYLAIASAIISIGLTLGAFGTGKGARDMAILAALLSLGSGYANFSTVAAKDGLTLATIGFAAQVAGTAVAAANAIDQYKFGEAMKTIAEETAALAVAGELYQSNLRFMYEDSYRIPQTALEIDPFDKIREVYEPYTVHKTKGFRTT